MDDHSGLLQAVARKNTSKVGELLRFAKAYDSNGFTALMYAALDGYEDGVRMLMGLEHGMRVSGSYSYGAYVCRAHCNYACEHARTPWSC